MKEENISHASFRLVAVPSSLCEKVVARVRIAEEKAARRDSLVCLAMACVSFVLCIGAGFWLWGDLGRSEFFQSFSLLFSDSSIVLKYWQDFSSTLFEALPLLSLASCFLALSVAVASVYALFKYRAKYVMLYSRTKLITYV
jgi:hypothetical protein